MSKPWEGAEEFVCTAKCPVCGESPHSDARQAHLAAIRGAVETLREPLELNDELHFYADMLLPDEDEQARENALRVLLGETIEPDAATEEPVQ